MVDLENRHPTPSETNAMRHTLLILLATLCLLAPGAAAQTTPPPTPGQTTRAALPTATELEQDPVRIDALNLNIFLPKGSVAETTSFGANATLGVGFPDQVAVMIIKEQRTNDPELSVSQVADNIIRQLTRFGNSKTGSLLTREKTLQIKLWKGERFYVRLAGVDGKPDTVRGMTIFQSQPQRFVIFDLTTLYKDFDIARTMYETSVGTMDLGNPTEQDVRRAAALKRMLSFMDLRSVDDYQQAMTGKKDRWERLYLPAPSGDDMDATEYGYRRVRSWGGFKGELTDKPQSKWSKDDRTLGYFVQIDAMALDQDLRVDTRSTFYMAEDGSEESWTIKMSLRQGDEQQTSTITGARARKNLVVMTDSSSSPPSKISPLIQGEGYVSQTLTYMLGNLLAQNADPGEYASYAYNSAQGKISLRWDMVEHPEDTPDLIKVTTKVSNDTPPTVSLYDKDGKLLRVRLANGRIWEPIELDRLIKLWQRKGLPLD